MEISKTKGWYEFRFIRNFCFPCLKRLVWISSFKCNALVWTWLFMCFLCTMPNSIEFSCKDFSSSLLAENVTPSYFSSLLSPLGGASMNTKKKRKVKKKLKKKNKKEMQFLEGNSCEPWLQRPLACFWNYLCILSFLCFTYSPLAPLQPRLNDQLILGGIVVRMVESPIDDIFHEIFVLFHCSSFL